MGDTRVDHASGAARQRRERRLRAYPKCARMSVAMAMAEANHHTAPGQNHERHAKVARDAVYFELFDEDTARLRPGPVLDPRPQERVQRQTVEQMIDVTPYVQILDAPVPQTGNQLLDVFTVEQVIAVPKISLVRIPRRLVERRLPQMLEQLVLSLAPAADSRSARQRSSSASWWSSFSGFSPRTAVNSVCGRADRRHSSSLS